MSAKYTSAIRTASSDRVPSIRATSRWNNSFRASGMVRTSTCMATFYKPAGHFSHFATIAW